MSALKLSTVEGESNGEKKVYTPEEVNVILDEIENTSADEGDEAAERKLSGFVDDFTDFVTRTTGQNDGNKLREVFIALNEKIKSGQSFKNDDGSIMNLDGKIDMVSELVGLVFAERRNSQ